MSQYTNLARHGNGAHKLFKSGITKIELKTLTSNSPNVISTSKDEIKSFN